MNLVTFFFKYQYGSDKPAVIVLDICDKDSEVTLDILHIFCQFIIVRSQCSPAQEWLLPIKFIIMRPRQYIFDRIVFTVFFFERTYEF
jgi:hypothetical protein